ncbi:MAG: aminopeptidase P family protein [Proteobacteria bacterium]|nr:aminopeptidase P family protein [Pseudomonadota bacterium]
MPLRVVEGSFFAARSIKTADEIKKLAAAQRANEQGMEHAFGILRACKIGKDKRLRWQGSVLTSEALGQEMNAFLLRQGCMGFNGGPIVGCGVYGAMPHGGHGPLRPHELIVIDSFPTHRNGYCGDLTRTVVKGKPTDWQRMVYGTVLEAQKLALGLIKPGVNGAEIHRAVGRFFERAGFPAGADSKGRPQGFFHGLGHAVGLEVHDMGAGMGGADAVLRVGSVTSVEPGLYYPSTTTLNGVKGGPGGCRIEDVVVVTATGYKNLTKLDKKNWVIE